MCGPPGHEKEVTPVSGDDTGRGYEKRQSIKGNTLKSFRNVQTKRSQQRRQAEKEYQRYKRTRRG